MTFDEALKEMRKGKEVAFPTRFVPLTMKHGKIVEVFEHNGKKEYDPLYSMNTCNIIRGDWEVVG